MNIKAVEIKLYNNYIFKLDFTIKLSDIKQSIQKQIRKNRDVLSSFTKYPRDIDISQLTQELRRLYISKVFTLHEGIDLEIKHRTLKLFISKPIEYYNDTVNIILDNNEKIKVSDFIHLLCMNYEKEVVYDLQTELEIPSIILNKNINNTLAVEFLDISIDINVFYH